MKERRSWEKLVWTGSWLGSLTWLPLLAFIIWSRHGMNTYSLLVFSLALLAVFLVILLAPWKHPDTSYWKLMLPLYLVIMLGILFTLFFFKAVLGLQTLILLPGIFPLLLPLLIIGKRTWSDQDKKD